MKGSKFNFSGGGYKVAQGSPHWCADEGEVAQLREQVQKLSLGREKLTKELDLQVEETDRLTIENAALTQVRKDKAL